MNVWHIDHDPTKPGTHRGILCGFCNTALGRLEGNLDKVLAYLAKHKGNSNDQHRHDTFDYELGQEDDVQSQLCDRKLS